MSRRPTWHCIEEIAPDGRVWGWNGGDWALYRAQDGKGLARHHVHDVPLFGQWDGERGTDGALLTLSTGDVLDESGNLISRGGEAR